jgi:hypothetical protein
VLPPGSRSGLMLFLCRGMWGWVRSVQHECLGASWLSTSELEGAR